MCFSKNLLGCGEGGWEPTTTQLADLMLNDEILLRSMKFDEKAWVEGPFFWSMWEGGSVVRRRDPDIFFCLEIKTSFFFSTWERKRVSG